MEEELDETVYEENHHTRPQHPISGRGDEPGLSEAAHLVKAGQLGPFTLTNLHTDALAVVDKEGTDKTIGNDGAKEPRESSVKANQDTGTKEGRRQLNVPAPVLNVKGPIRVSTPC
jgi:hypothetical protein